MPGAATQQDKGNGGPDPKHNIEAAREEFYQRISKRNMAPLWKVMSSVVTKEPVTRCVPHVWHYDDVKSLVMESGGLITAEEALRRVLILENPALRGQSRATNTMFAGVQMILPGEVAPAHRHVSSAIRFVLDGEGAYTAVEGEKAIMAPGDFVITANWAPHDHGNDSKEPMMWLDVLDFPMVNFFETSFAQQYAEKTQPTGRGDGDSLAFYGSGGLPDNNPARGGPAPGLHHTPAPGAPWRPPRGATRALLPRVLGGEPYRSTDGTVFVCVEGKGSTKVGDETLDWGPNDVFVIPPWKRYAHTAATESVLFSISDRPAQEALGIWREES